MKSIVILIPVEDFGYFFTGKKMKQESRCHVINTFLLNNNVILP